MGITIVAHNMLAAYGSRQLNITANTKQKSVEKLSSGYRINRSADDAAGLSISEKMRRQIRGLSRGAQNSQDGISFCQVADGAMNEIQSMLHRMNELCVQAANGTNSPEDRASIQSEINQLKIEIDRISDTTSFNDMPVFHDVGVGPNESIANVLGSDCLKGGSNFSEPLIAMRQPNQFHTGLVSDATTEGRAGYAGRIGYPYSSVMMDFSQLGTSYTYEDLVGKSLSITDSTSNQQYNIVFGSNSDTGGRPYRYSGVGDVHTLAIKVEGATDGSDLARSIFTAIGNTPVYTDAGIQYARDSFGKLWVYDNKTDNFGHASIKFASPAGADENADKIWIQSGDTAENGLWITKPYLNTSILGVDSIDVTSADNAKASLSYISDAFGALASLRGDIGAQQNRIEHTINVVEITRENLESSESKIRDTDMAKETVKMQKQSILEQTGQSILSQANQMQESVLNILK